MSDRDVYGDDLNSEGFVVEYLEPQPDMDEWEAGYAVYLPHKCGRWGISGTADIFNEPVSKEEAIADLTAFLADGQAALEALKADG